MVISLKFVSTYQIVNKSEFGHVIAQSRASDKQLPESTRKVWLHSSQG